MHNEAVSVVVPVYNGADHLAAAIESILAQECKAKEIIVVDDGSTDATPDVVNHISDRVLSVRQDNLGPGAARNTGVRLATAPLIAFLDADDVWLPTALTHHLAVLRANPSAAIAWGRSSRVVDPDARPPRDDWHGQPQWALSVGAMLFRRSVFDEIGGFDPTLRFGEDLDFMIRIIEQRIPLVRHPQIVCEIRFHANNMTRDEAASDRAYFVAIRKAFERRRLNMDSKQTQNG